MPVRVYSITKAVAANGTAVPLSDTPLHVKSLVLRAAKVGGSNTGSVFLGDSTVDKTNNQQITLVKDTIFEFPSQNGDTFDLSEIYIDAATNDDGVTGIYTI